MSVGLSIGSSVTFILLLGVLHVLRPDLSPSWHFISDYEVGRFAWVMHAAFLSLAISCAGVLVMLWPHARGIVGRLGLLLLALSAGGIALAGVFAPSTENRLHELGAMLDQLPLAVLFITWSLWRNPAWRAVRRTLALIALVLLAGMGYFIWAMVVYQPSPEKPPSPTALIGWPSRIFILTHCAWLIPISWRAGQANMSVLTQPASVNPSSAVPKPRCIGRTT
jgi:hypothetical membrane protein